MKFINQLQANRLKKAKRQHLADSYGLTVENLPFGRRVLALEEDQENYRPATVVKAIGHTGRCIVMFDETETVAGIKAGQFGYVNSLPDFLDVESESPDLLKVWAARESVTNNKFQPNQRVLFFDELQKTHMLGTVALQTNSYWTGNDFVPGCVYVISDETLEMEILPDLFVTDIDECEEKQTSLFIESAKSKVDEWRFTNDQQTLTLVEPLAIEAPEKSQLKNSKQQNKGMEL